MKVNMSNKKQPLNAHFMNIAKNLSDHFKVRKKKKIHEIL